MLIRHYTSFFSGLTNRILSAIFHEGLAAVRVSEKWGFIDKNGNMVINPEYDKAELFSEGLAAVALNGKWGYIDRAGRWVVKPQYEFADDFSEGFAGVVGNGKYGFINKQGELVIPARFDVRRELRHPELLVSAGRFKEGLAAVAVAWLIAQPSVTAPIASVTSSAQLQNLVQAIALKLDQTSLDKLNRASSG